MESQMVDGPWKYKPKVLYIMGKHISISKKIWKKIIIAKKLFRVSFHKTLLKTLG